MDELQLEKYKKLMKVVRDRLDSIKSISSNEFTNFNDTEIAAFHGRKIIEAIAFGCLIGTKNGFKTIPKDAEGQYNAEKIFKTLNRKGIEIFPSPSEIRQATPEESIKHNVKIVIDGIPERRITKEELIKKYQRMHNWLHELNPYTREEQQVFYEKHQGQLVRDLEELRLFLVSHVMSINGEAFFCTLYDKIDGTTKVISLSKISDL
jgi:queuine/archaeosine tRNA-ribosyltransferase